MYWLKLRLLRFSVPAYVDITGNELADSKAKQAASSYVVDISEISVTDLSVYFKEKVTSILLVPLPSVS